MALNFKVGTFAKPGSTTTPFDHAVTGVGFTPKLLILTAVGTNTSLASILRPGLGWSSGSTANYSISWGADNAVASSTNTFRRASDAYCFMLGSGSSTAYPKIKLKTFDADGFTLTFDLNDTATYNLYYICIGGADVTNVKAGSFTPNATTGTQDITDVGFSPDMVFFMGANTPVPTPSTPSTSVPGSSWFLGAAKSASAQNALANTSIDAVTPSDSARYQRTVRCIAYFDNGITTGTLDAEASYVNPISNGFTINILDAPATTQEPIFYLAIKGGSWNVGGFNALTTVGNQSVTTPLAHTPKGLIIYTGMNTSSATPAANGRYSLGAASGTAATSDRWCVLGGDEDNLGTATETIRGSMVGGVVRTAIETATPNTADSPTGDVTSRADLVSFNAGTGFTLNWVHTDGTARNLLYITVGDSPAGQTLVKLPAVTPEVTQITEGNIPRSRTLVRLPATTPESLQIAEGTVLHILGKVKVIGGFIPGAPAVINDFLEDDFEEADFTVDYTPPGGDPMEETTAISEGVVKVLSAGQVTTVSAANIQLRFSGGAAYNGNLNGGIDSLGGAMSSVVVTHNVLNSAWDDSSVAETAAGRTEFRCFYFYNNHSTLAMYDVLMWIDQNTPAGDEIQIAVGTASVSGTEPALSPLAENTVPPSGTVLFTPATDESSAVTLASAIPAQGYKSFWIKRHVPAGVSSWNDNTYTIRIAFISDHLPSDVIQLGQGFTGSGFLEEGFMV